jgi:hypothetical protein
MLPAHYVCTSCSTKFLFEFHEADYYLGTGDIGDEVIDKDLLAVPLRPAWCRDCGCVCPVEDIAPVRTFEATYAAVRRGLAFDYPFSSEHGDPSEHLEAVEAYLRWRMGRRHAARALCCGGSNFQFMDVATPLFKHAECDFGVVEPATVFPGPFTWSPGISGPINTRLYTTEGELIGVRTWLHTDRSSWRVKKLSYPPATSE